MKNRTITTLTTAGKIRAKMIEEFQRGVPADGLAKKYGYEKSMIYKYAREYEANGIAALNVERRPRETVHLTPAQWREHLSTATDMKEREYLQALLDVALKKISLNDAAKRVGVTPQGLMKVRRKYSG